MKKFTRWAAALSTSLALVASPLQARAEDVPVTDREMLGCINYELDRDYDAPVTAADLAKLTELTCYGAKDLSVLSRMPNLITLDLADGPSGAVTIPSSLTKLETLAITDGRMTSISIPSTLTRLSDIALDRNQLATLPLPTTLVNLRIVSASENRIADLANLSWLPKQTFLYAPGQIVPLPATVTGTGYAITSRGPDLKPPTLTPPPGVTWSNGKLTYSTPGSYSVSFEYLNDSFYGVFDGRFTQTVTQGVVLPTATGALGDQTGDKIADVYGIDGAGNLQLYKGSTTGFLSYRSKAGTGWGGVSYLAQVKDLTGDNRSDALVRRSADNSMWLYRGVGGGPLDPVKQIGYNWGGMDQIVPAMNLAGGSTQFVVGRRKSDGALFRYTLTPTGFSNTTQIGWNWGGMRQFLSVGDFTGDGRSDILGIRESDGTLWLYPGTTSGTLSFGRQIGHGWGTFTRAFVPGDLSGDGRPDLVGQRADGKVFTYRTQTGSFAPARQIMSGATGFGLMA